MTDTYRVAKSILNDVDPSAPVKVPLAPPAHWFKPPEEMTRNAEMGIPTKLQIVMDGPDAGRAFGHIAPFDQCILDGRPGCWTVPRDLDMHWSMQGVTELEDGSIIPTGAIPYDTNHAPDGTASEAVDYMAHTGRMLARVVYGTDSFGIWAAGALAPDVSYSDAVRARAAAQSGDWRAMITEMRFDDGRPPQWAFTGSICVNLPGFPLAVRLAAAASTPGRQFGPAIVVVKEPPTMTPTKTASVYSLIAKPSFTMGDEVTFAGGARRGKVLTVALDDLGAEQVTIQEAYQDGTLADCDDAIVVPASECAGTGRMFEFEAPSIADLAVDLGEPDVVVPDEMTAAAEAPACGCKHADETVVAAADAVAMRKCACDCCDHEGFAPMTASSALTLWNAVFAQTAAMGNGDAPEVDDPTDEIMLEFKDTTEKTLATIIERLDALEQAQAQSTEANAIAAALS